MTNTEATLVQQVLNGKKECYRPLVEAYQRRIYVLAASIMRNSAEAQDIAQESFLVAFKNLHELKDKTKFGTWLYGITRNLCYTALRKKKIEPERLDDVPPSEYANVVPMRPSFNEGEDLLDTLLKRLELLPEKYRTLLRLKYMEDLSYQEISEMLDLNIDIVRSRLFEGRRLLREGMEKAWRVQNGG